MSEGGGHGLISEGGGRGTVSEKANRVSSFGEKELLI